MIGIGAWAAATPGAPAFISPTGSMSFAELDARQRACAGYMLGLGLEPGDRIAIRSRNRSEIVEIVGAALRCGLVPVPINALLTPREIEYQIEDSGASVLFTDEATEVLPGVTAVVVLGDAYERCLTEARPATLAPITLTRPMHYTSGTSGLPKGVYAAPEDEAVATRRAERFVVLWNLRDDDVHLVCSPLAHSAPLRFALRTLEAGGSVIVPPRFAPLEVLAAIDLAGVTSTFMVPTHLERIVALRDDERGRFDLSSLRLVAHAGAPIREPTKRAAIAMFPPGAVWEFYGSTEGQATRISSEEWEERPGSVGRAHAEASVYVMSDDFTKLPADEIGQVWVRDEQGQPWVYFNDPAKTAGAWRDGAFTVGDLGHLDEEGYLFLSGRRTDLIISGGVNVYPHEVEAILTEHPAVEEAVVFGVADDEWGQRVHARIVPTQLLDPEALRDWARTRMASFKVPRVIEVVDELERTATGKLKRPGAGSP